MNRYATLCLVSAVVGAILANSWNSQPPPAATSAVAQAPAPAPAPATRGFEQSPFQRNRTQPRLTPEEVSNIHVYDEANRAVVNVTTSTVQYDRFFMVRIPGEGSGSGSVLDKSGHILTNYHVVEDAEKVDVTLANGDTYPADLIGFDQATDIAVLKIDAPVEELHPLTMGTSEGLKVGQKVYVLGNPFGMERSLSTGIISSLNRTPPGGSRNSALQSLIQTDAAMNPGNSGGPLLNTSAEMIGMNVAIATKTGQNAGVGFAIPANRIRNIVPELIRNGKVVRPDHGILAVMETDRGLKIHQLAKGGPADRAGLRGFRFVIQEKVEGRFRITRRVPDRNYADFILGVDGKSIQTHHEFLDVIEEYKPGDTVIFTILRDGRRQKVPVTLDAA